MGNKNAKKAVATKETKEVKATEAPVAEVKAEEAAPAAPTATPTTAAKQDKINVEVNENGIKSVRVTIPSEAAQSAHMQRNSRPLLANIVVTLDNGIPLRGTKYIKSDYAGQPRKNGEGVNAKGYMLYPSMKISDGKKENDEPKFKYVPYFEFSGDALATILTVVDQALDAAAAPAAEQAAA